MIVVNRFFEERAEQLVDLAKIADAIFASAGIEYRIVGGLAVYMYVEQAEPDAGRLTKDVDAAIKRGDLDRVAAAAKTYGFELRHVAGVDILARSSEPSTRRAIHLVFAGEHLGPAVRIGGLSLIPLADLVRMKLTAFRA